jgi:Na+-transporting methylmalonyl-CoA/oxaloacetate decarboxylase gamma subunit/uncharacterized protein YuzE
MQTYQIVLIILVLVVLASGLIFYFTKKDNKPENKPENKSEKTQEKDRNLKTVVKLINKENYEEVNTSNNNDDRCSKILSLFGDTNNKGLLDIYKDITGKGVVLPSNCNNETLNTFILIMLTMISEMCLNAIENPDKEKGYYDLVALYLFVINALAPSSEVKDFINVTYDSNGKIENIEIKQNKVPVTPAAFINALVERNRDGNVNQPTGRTPEITEYLKKTQEKARSIVKVSDLDNLKNNNNSKMKVTDFGLLLSFLIAQNGTFIK